MVSSVSGVTQANNIPTTSREQLYSPGAYTLNTMDPPHRHKKHGGFLGFLVKTAVAAAIIGGVAARISTHSLKDFNVSGKAEKGFMNNVKYYTKKLGDLVNNKVITKVKGIFKKSEKTEPPKSGEGSSEK